MKSSSVLPPASSDTIEQNPKPLAFVHRYYIFLKLHYFLFFSAFGIIYPVLSITLRNQGLSNRELSLLNAIVPFIVFFSNPMIGFVADRTRRYLSTFNIVLVAVVALYGILFLLPSIRTHAIQGQVVYDPSTSRRMLEFCANPNVAISCASRSACGCTYKANCTTYDSDDADSQQCLFDFSMNSKAIYKHAEQKIQSTCGIDYQISIEHLLVNNSLGK
jgi:nitrate/nitrite transporter NarK